MTTRIPRETGAGPLARRSRSESVSDWNTARAIFPRDPDRPDQFELTANDAPLVAHVGPDNVLDLTRAFLEHLVIWNLDHDQSVIHRISGDEVVAMPATLQAALWHQFTNAVLQDKHYRRCKSASCPRGWFEVRSGHGAVL